MENKGATTKEHQSVTIEVVTESKMTVIPLPPSETSI